MDPLAWARLKAQVGVGTLGLPEEELDGGRGVQHRTALVLSGDLPGPVTLVVGRAALPGEAEAAMDDELAPDGAFWCLGLDRDDPAAARRVLQDLGYRVVWVLETEHRSDEVTAPPAGSVLTWAWFRTPDLVDLRLATPEQARAWEAGGSVWTPGDPVPDWAPSCG